MKTIIICTIAAICAIAARFVLKYIRRQQRIRYEKQLAQYEAERKLFYQQECQRLINRFRASYRTETSAPAINGLLRELYFLLCIYGSHSGNRAEWIRLFWQVAEEAHNWLEHQQPQAEAYKAAIPQFSEQEEFNFCCQLLGLTPANLNSNSLEKAYFQAQQQLLTHNLNPADLNDKLTVLQTVHDYLKARL